MEGERGFSEEEIKRINADYYVQAMTAYKMWIWSCNKQCRENPKKHYENVKRYSNSPKGRIAVRRREAVRKDRVSLFYVTDEEKALIKDFYANCPNGYEVDHIIPVSKGGRHAMSNLQYLTKERNRYKHDLIICDTSLPPHCPLGW